MKIFPNIIYDNNKKILELSTYEFRNKTQCQNRNLKVGDIITGILENGIFKKAKISYLLSLKETQEAEILKLKNSNKGFLSVFNKKFSYPFVSNFILTTRESFEGYDESGVARGTATEYFEAFYNTLAPGGLDLLNAEFKVNFRKDFLDFIMVRYVKNNKLILKIPEQRDRILSLLIELEKDIENGSPRYDYYDKPYLTRNDFINIVESLTGRSESTEEPEVLSGDAVRTLLRDVKYNIDFRGRTFPLLRFCSYFIFCEQLTLGCNQIRNVSSEITSSKGEKYYLKSMELLKNLPGEKIPYKLYYNENTKQFTQA